MRLMTIATLFFGLIPGLGSADKCRYIPDKKSLSKNVLRVDIDGDHIIDEIRAVWCSKELSISRVSVIEPQDWLKEYYTSSSIEKELSSFGSNLAFHSCLQNTAMAVMAFLVVLGKSDCSAFLLVSPQHGIRFSRQEDRLKSFSGSGLKQLELRPIPRDFQVSFSKKHGFFIVSNDNAHMVVTFEQDAFKSYIDYQDSDSPFPVSERRRGMVKSRFLVPIWREIQRPKN
jgi:hypothetical protein